MSLTRVDFSLVRYSDIERTYYFHDPEYPTAVQFLLNGRWESWDVGWVRHHAHDPNIKRIAGDAEFHLVRNGSEYRQWPSTPLPRLESLDRLLFTEQAEETPSPCQMDPPPIQSRLGPCHQNPSPPPANGPALPTRKLSWSIPLGNSPLTPSSPQGRSHPTISPPDSYTYSRRHHPLHGTPSPSSEEYYTPRPPTQTPSPTSKILPVVAGIAPPLPPIRGVDCSATVDSPTPPLSAVDTLLSVSRPLSAHAPLTVAPTSAPLPRPVEPASCPEETGTKESNVKKRSHSAIETHPAIGSSGAKRSRPDYKNRNPTPEIQDGRTH